MFKKKESRFIETDRGIFNEEYWVRTYACECECGASVYLPNIGDLRCSCTRWYRSIPTLMYRADGTAHGETIVQQLKLTEDGSIKVIDEFTLH